MRKLSAVAALCLLGLLGGGPIGCGDDDDDGGGDGGGGDGACEHAQALCQDDDSVGDYDCSELASAPASLRQCIMNASTCDAVVDCAIDGAGGS